jgi:uncharacterized protein (TIGR02246 family)
MHRTPHRYHAPDKVEMVKLSVGRLEQAWNSKNTYLWASAFTEPCQYIDALGTFHRDWSHNANAQLHEKVWHGPYQRSHARFLIESLEFVGDHACMVILHAEIHYHTDEKEGVLETYITLMAEQHGQEWLIRYFQNTPIRSPK